MRHRYIGGALLAAAAMLAPATPARAQDGLPPPLNSNPTIPIPTGAAGSAGFYTAAEFVILTQNRTIGNQVVAYRGFVDSSGQITGLPGTYVGSGQVGLSTNDFGRTTYQPGWKVELGYSFEDGTRVYGNFLQLFNAQYAAGATLASPYFRSRQDQADTFLVAGVYNFPPAFAGPAQKTAYDVSTGGIASNTYGIWNAASVMDIKYSERFTTAEAGLRTPLFQTDYSRVYGSAGARFAWFFERFTWRTVSFDVNGVANPQDVANYSNTLSQRMYGPFVGCGHEVFLANQFSLSLDLSAALLLNIAKERAKYELGDNSDPAKRGWETFTVVPNANLALNLWWYPTEGVQMRVGYSLMTFFNTRNMLDPIGFNYGAIDPVYEVQAFRYVHGVNVGIGLFF